MAGGAVLNLADWGAYSGCSQTSTSPGQEFVRVVTQGRGGIEPELMWGPVGSQRWIENDPTVNAEKLRGVPYIYVSSATGIPGELERFDGLGIPAQFKYRPTGIHTWVYWQQDLHESWPGMAAVLDVPPAA